MFLSLHFKKEAFTYLFENKNILSFHTWKKKENYDYITVTVNCKLCFLRKEGLITNWSWTTAKQRDLNNYVASDFLRSGIVLVKHGEL